MKNKILIFAIIFLGSHLFSKSSQVYSLEGEKMDKEIHIFIHVCTIRHWRDVLDRQLNRIQASGLYDACNSISLGILGVEDVSPFLERYPKLAVLFQDPNTTLYERPTLMQLHAFCQEHSAPSLVLYLHTKGISREPKYLRNVTDWANFMEYFAIDRWQDCVSALHSHDACGVNWRSFPAPHFSGNFWWATSDYVATLPNRIGIAYCDPEFWIGLNAPLVKCFHDAPVDHYFEPYSESRYIIQDENLLQED